MEKVLINYVKIVIIPVKLVLLGPSMIVSFVRNIFTNKEQNAFLNVQQGIYFIS